MAGIGPIEMGRKTSCVGIEAGRIVVVAIEVNLGEVDSAEVYLVEFDQINLEADWIEIKPFEVGLVGVNLVIVDRMKIDPFWIELVEVNLVVVDLKQHVLEVLVNSPIAEETGTERKGLGGLLEEATVLGGGVILFSLIAAGNLDRRRY